VIDELACLSGASLSVWARVNNREASTPIRISRHPQVKGRTRLIAVVLHPRDVQEIAIPKKQIYSQGK
jgi:hypothetical protein